MSRAYWASLPERAVRAAAAGAGGLLYETTEVALPPFVRRSRLYQATVARLLRITTEMVGGVRGVYREEEIPVRELAVRKLAGNALELAGFLAVGWSPVWLLAAASDLSNGTRTYLRTLVAELKRTGLLPSDANVTSVEQLLNSLEQVSGTVADTVDVPPLNVSQLRQSWQVLQQHTGDLPDQESLAALYRQLQQVAQQEGRSILSVSSTVASGAVQAGVQLGNTYIFDYYREALGSIQQEGFPPYVQRVARPYI
ncbi:MAG TPA: hypothetical protein VHN78_06515, partial [Chloroflexota bacterium]|nr:hypothetical protein [Chloroflexota bacterium]